MLAGMWEDSEERDAEGKPLLGLSLKLAQASAQPERTSTLKVPAARLMQPWALARMEDLCKVGLQQAVRLPHSTMHIEHSTLHAALAPPAVRELRGLNG